MSHTYPITMQQDAAPAGPIDAIVRGAVLSLADCLRAPRVRTATVEADAQGLPILAAPFPAAPAPAARRTARSLLCMDGTAAGMLCVMIQPRAMFPGTALC